MQQHEDHEQQADGEEHSRRIAANAEPTGDRVEPTSPRGERNENDARKDPQQRVPLTQTSRPDELEDDKEQNERCRSRRNRDLQRRLRPDHVFSSGITSRRNRPTKSAVSTFAM